MRQADSAGFNPNPVLAESLSIRCRRTWGIFIGEGPIITRRLSVTIELNRTDVPGCDGIAGQRGSVCDP